MVPIKFPIVFKFELNDTIKLQWSLPLSFVNRRDSILIQIKVLTPFPRLKLILRTKRGPKSQWQKWQVFFSKTEQYKGYIVAVIEDFICKTRRKKCDYLIDISESFKSLQKPTNLR